MKAYTDLEQSKKLAEILPLESADMIYILMMDIDSMGNSGFFDIPECYPFNEFKDSDTKPLPCWSLAALLSVLPKNLNIGRPSLDSNYMGYYWIQYYDEFMKSNNYKTECFNNPVDACVDMVIKLHEQKLL